MHLVPETPQSSAVIYIKDVSVCVDNRCVSITPRNVQKTEILVMETSRFPSNINKTFGFQACRYRSLLQRCKVLHFCNKLANKNVNKNALRSFF